MVASDRIQVTTMNFLNAQKQSIFDDSDTYFDYLRAAKMNIEQVEAFGQEDPIVEYYQGCTEVLHVSAVYEVTSGQFFIYVL